MQYDTETEQVKNCITKLMQNFGENIHMSPWENLCIEEVKFIECQILRENWYKMCFRWYITPKDIAKANRDYIGKSWQYQNANAMFYLMWWTCRKSQKYWTKEIHEEMQKIPKLNFAKDKKKMLLNILPSNVMKIYGELSSLTVGRADYTSNKINKNYFTIWCQRQE